MHKFLFSIAFILSFFAVKCQIEFPSKYFPKGVLEIRTKRILFKKGTKANGKDGEYSLHSSKEIRKDKIIRYTELLHRDTIQQTVYNYEGNLTEGRLFSKLDITFNKKRRDIIKDTLWTIYQYNLLEHLPSSAIILSKSDTLFIAAYTYDNADYLKNITYWSNSGKKQKMTKYLHDAYGNCIKIQNLNYNSEEELFEIEDEYKIDVDYSENKKVIGLHYYYRKFGEHWYLKEEYEMNRKGKYTSGTMFLKRDSELDYYEYKFEHDFN